MSTATAWSTSAITPRFARGSGSGFSGRRASSVGGLDNLQRSSGRNATGAVGPADDAGGLTRDLVLAGLAVLLGEVRRTATLSSFTRSRRSSACP
jgi:hypothetical protein